MAQELEVIVDLLKEMRRANNKNIESFDKLLASINDKLDLMEENEDSIKLIKVYLEELTKTVELKYSTTAVKFNDIQKALNILFEEADEHAQSKNMLKAYNTFSKNLTEFNNHLELQKEITGKINTSLSSLKNNKEDIKISLQQLKDNFEQLNHAYKNITNSLSSNLKPIIANIADSDNKKLKTNAKKQIEIIGNAVKEIITYLKSAEEKDLNLEKLLNNIAANENLKYTQGIIDLIIEKSDNISKKIVSLASKSDIEELQNISKATNSEMVSKKDFEKITLKTEAIVNQTEEVKQKLAKVTQNIEGLPGTKLLEESLQKLFQKLETLNEDIKNCNIKGDSFDIESKLALIKEEVSTVKNIVTDIKEAVVAKVLSCINEISFENESYDIKQHISKMLSRLPQKGDIERIIIDNEHSSKIVNILLEKADNISEKLENSATQQDIENIKENQSTLAESIQNLANKDDISSLASQTDEIEQMIDNLNLDNEFENIYNKASSIEDWLISSKIKENTEEIIQQMPNKAEKKDLSQILETTAQIVEILKNFSQSGNGDTKTVTISNAELKLEDLKTEILNTTELHNDSVISKLSEIKTAIDSAATAEEFNNIAEDLKDFVQLVLNNSELISTNLDEIKQKQENLSEKLENLDFSNLTDSLSQNIHSFKEDIQEAINSQQLELSNKTDNIENKLTTISEYLNKDLKINEEEIIREISEIKEIIQNKKSNFDGIEIEKSLNINSIERYLEDIKTVLDTSDKGISDSIKKQLNNVENELNNYKSFNENQFTQILDKLNEYQQLTRTDSLHSESLSDTVAEILQLKDQIQQLGESFAILNLDKTSETSVSGFVAEKLNELSENLSTLSENIDNGLQQGFAYNAELIEEKSAVLLDFIKELRHASTENIDLYERLTVTDNKIMDFKQELELINTDVINDLNSKTDKLIKELSPIKELLTCLAVQTPEGPQTGKIKEQLGILHDSVQDDITECTKYAKSTFERLEETYEQISKDLTSTERNLRDFILGDIDSVIIKIDNCTKYAKSTFERLEETYEQISKDLTSTERNLRDFILGDIDSVIIKIDNLKSDLENTLNQITPPDAEQMEELHTFVSQIVNFKNEQQEYLKEIAEDIKTSINDKITSQHDEIKSMITVAMNNEEIIQAIEKLKRCFKSKIKELSKIQHENQNISDEFGTNQYEEVFEKNKNAKVIEEIKDDFNKFSSLISNLSDENPEIEEVLNKKLKRCFKSKIKELSKIQHENQNISDEFGTNQYEEVFEKNKNAKVIEEIKDDFNKFSSLISNLSDENPEIEEVLNTIKEKIDTITVVKNNKVQRNNNVDILPDEDFSEGENEDKEFEELAVDEDFSEGNDEDDFDTDDEEDEILLGANNFDFIKAFDLLKQDINNLRSDIERVLPENVRSSSLNSIPTLGNNNLLMSLNNKVELLAKTLKTDWLEEIKGYLAGGEIHSLLEDISDKINILTLTDNSEWIQEIKQALEQLNAGEINTGSNQEIQTMLALINEKIDILASSDDHDLMEDVRDVIERIYEDDLDNQSRQNEDIKKLLSNLDQKIDIIATSDNYDIHKSF